MMVGSENTRKFAVVIRRDELIQCIGVKEGFDNASCLAYEYMDNYIDDHKEEEDSPNEAIVSVKQELEGEAGMFFSFTYDDVKTVVYILEVVNC